MRGTIRPRRLRAKGQLVVVGVLQAARCQRRAPGVTDEAFQTRSVVTASRRRRERNQARERLLREQEEELHARPGDNSHHP